MTDEKPLILIVDDENDARGYLYALLDSEGYRVATSTGGMEALKYISGHKPDVVIADIRMPEMDGFELLERIQSASPKTQTILISAHGKREILLQALERGARGFLEKPYRNDRILETVSRVLQGATP